MDNIHAGHRSRLKENFIKHGIESFNDLNALELILFYAKPRGDVNPIAHALLDRFGSLSGVMDAPMEELMSVNGVGENTATLLKLIPQLGRRYLINLNGDKPILDDPQKAGQFLIPYFMDAQEEKICIVCLNAGLKVVHIEMIAEGGLTSVDVNIRKLVETALRNKAVKIIIAHNHPSGNTIPSPEDINITRRIRVALKMIDVELSDHLIISGNEFSSMAKCGVFTN